MEAHKKGPGGPSNEARLQVLTQDLLPSDVSNAVGLQPDRIWHKGDAIGRTGRASQPFHGWAIGTQPNDHPLESHLDAVLDRVTAASARIADLSRHSDVHSISLWLWSAGQPLGLVIPPSTLEAIASLGATLKIDFHDGEGLGDVTDWSAAE